MLLKKDCELDVTTTFWRAKRTSGDVPLSIIATTATPRHDACRAIFDRRAGGGVSAYRKHGISRAGTPKGCHIQPACRIEQRYPVAHVRQHVDEVASDRMRCMRTKAKEVPGSDEDVSCGRKLFSAVMTTKVCHLGGKAFSNPGGGKISFLQVSSSRVGQSATR